MKDPGNLRRVPRLETRPVAGRADVAAHFDGLAPTYRDVHGDAAEGLARRLGLIRALLAGRHRGTLLEIGCGTGIHLVPLAADFERAVGTDLSPAMVGAAREAAARVPWGGRVEVRVDPAEELATVADGSADAVLCVGALEHMLDRPRVLAQVRRVLVPGGAFVCLTPNGGWWWYRYLAPRLRLATRHLSTDRFLTAAELARLAAGAGLAVGAVETWPFVPRGDMPRLWAALFSALDPLAARLGVAGLRGGLALAADRPQEIAGARASTSS